MDEYDKKPEITIEDRPTESDNSIKGRIRSFWNGMESSKKLIIVYSLIAIIFIFFVLNSIKLVKLFFV